MSRDAWDGLTDVPRETQELLTSYVDLLLVENERQNLIARSTADQVWSRHIEDSLQLVTHLDGEENKSVLDLGSGPGLPGLVLAIAKPLWKLHLVESRRKRCEFLSDVVQRLGLENVRIHCTNLRSLTSFTVDAITARAFAPLPALLDMAAPFANRNTAWVLPRGAKGDTELAELPKKRKSMFHVERSLTDTNAVILVGKGTP